MTSQKHLKICYWMSTGHIWSKSTSFMCHFNPFPHCCFHFWHQRYTTVTEIFLCRCIHIIWRTHRGSIWFGYNLVSRLAQADCEWVFAVCLSHAAAAQASWAQLPLKVWQPSKKFQKGQSSMWFLMLVFPTLLVGVPCTKKMTLKTNTYQNYPKVKGFSL